MSNYTKDSPDIYFLNDKNIVSSYDTVPTSINPIPSFDLAVSGYNELTSFKHGATLSIAGLCLDLSTTNDKLTIQTDKIDELSTFKGNAKIKIRKLSSDLAIVSNNVSVNTHYVNELVGLDAPYSKGIIKTLSDDIEAIKTTETSSIKYHKNLIITGELFKCTDLLDLFYKTNILNNEKYVMNGTIVNVFVIPNDEKLTVALGTDTITLGNGDIIVIHSPTLPTHIYWNDLHINTVTSEGNIHLIKAGVSEYEFCSEISNRISADQNLCTYLSNDIYTKELSLDDSEISSIEDIANEYEKDHWNNGDIIIVKKHLFREVDKTACEYTGYVFKDSTWQAMEGNYNADNVYFNHEFTLAGNYKSIGNINKESEATISSFFCKDKITKLFERMFSIHEDPTVLDQPTLSLKVKDSSTNEWPAYAEVGTTITPVLTATLTRGRYTPWKVCTETDHSGTYRQNPTNVSKLTCVVQSTYGHHETFITESPDIRTGSQLTANTSFDLSCSLDSKLLSIGEPYNITVKPEYNDDVKVALDNEGKTTTIQVNAITAQKTTNSITPYYKAFYGSQTVVSAFVEGEDATALRSVSSIKSTASTLTASTIKFTSGAGTRQLVIILPHEDKEWLITKLYDGTAYADILGMQGPVTMKLNDAGGTARNYDVWHVDYGPDVKMDNHEIQVTIA